MNKLTIPIILSVTVLIAGVFAFMPVEKATTVDAKIIAASGLEVHSLTKTLVHCVPGGCPPDFGPDQTWTLTAESDVVVQGVWKNNTPTADSECTITALNSGNTRLETTRCLYSHYRITDVEIDGDQYRGKHYPDDTARFNRLNINHIDFGGLSGLPLNAGEKLELSFDTKNTTNDVVLEVSFAVKGDATLT